MLLIFFTLLYFNLFTKLHLFDKFFTFLLTALTVFAARLLYREWENILTVNKNLSLVCDDCNIYHLCQTIQHAFYSLHYTLIRNLLKDLCGCPMMLPRTIKAHQLRFDDICKEACWSS